MQGIKNHLAFLKKVTFSHKLWQNIESLLDFSLPFNKHVFLKEMGRDSSITLSSTISYHRFLEKKIWYTEGKQDSLHIDYWKAAPEICMSKSSLAQRYILGFRSKSLPFLPCPPTPRPSKQVTLESYSQGIPLRTIFKLLLTHQREPPTP